MKITRSELGRINLLRLRKEKGLTQDDVAKSIGSNKGTISQIETGTKNLGTNIEKRLISAYKLDLSFFTQLPAGQDIIESLPTPRLIFSESAQGFENRNLEDYTTVPLVSGRIAAGAPIMSDEDIEGWAVIHVSQVGRKQKLVTTRIQDDKSGRKTGEFTGRSMEPILGPGDIVAIDRNDKPETPAKNKIYAVRKDTGGVVGATLKYLQKDGEILLLVPENKDFPIETINLREEPDPIIGRVIWCWRSMK